MPHSHTKVSYTGLFNFFRFRLTPANKIYNFNQYTAFNFTTVHFQHLTHCDVRLAITERRNVCLPTSVRRIFIYIRGAKRLCTGPRYKMYRQTDGRNSVPIARLLVRLKMVTIAFHTTVKNSNFVHLFCQQTV